MDTIMATQTPTSNNFRLNGVAMAAMLMGLGWILYQGLFLGLTESNSSTYLAVGLIACGFVWQVLVFLFQAIESSVQTYRIGIDGVGTENFPGIADSDSHLTGTDSACSNDDWSNSSCSTSAVEHENRIFDTSTDNYESNIYSSPLDTPIEINPSTGLPMIGATDVNGNFYGESNS